MKRRVAVTGLAAVSPWGIKADDFFQHMLRGDSAVRWHVLPDQGMAIPSIYCENFDAVALLGKTKALGMERFSQMAVVAAREAWQSAGLDEDAQVHADRGVSWGTALGGLLAFEKGYRDFWQHHYERVNPLSVVLGMNNAAAGHISMQLGLGNSSLTYTVACASAAAAIGEGFCRIRDGRATMMMTGGSDAPLAYAVIKAWQAMRVLAPADEHTAFAACRPFHQQRAGLVLGEGAAALLLEEWEHAKTRKAPILAELAGCGVTSDAFHPVRPNALGQSRAIRMALQDANLAVDEVGYVNAHGTATVEGDPIEIKALKDVFGARAKDVIVSATKSMHGHMMGATGAVEAVITVLALKEDAAPPTAHLDSLDPACAGMRHVTGEALRGTHLKAALSNSFAFGGSNVVLALRAAI